MKITNSKVVISGNNVEVYEFEKPLGYNFRSKSRKIISEKEIDIEKEKIRKQDIRLRSGHRARNYIRRLVPANANVWLNDSCEPYKIKFGTLTFAENITDLEIANGLYTDFIKRLNYLVFKTKISNLAYTAIPEFQKRGAVHFHIIFYNLPCELVEKELEAFRLTKLTKKSHVGPIGNVWKLGYVSFKPLNNIEHAANYISKYMYKNFNELRLDGKKKYFCSRNLKIPKIFKNPKNTLPIIDRLQVNTTVYEKEFDSPILGKTKYKKYILTDYELSELKDFVYELHLKQIPCNTLSTAEDLLKLKINKFSQ